MCDNTAAADGKMVKTIISEYLLLLRDFVGMDTSVHLIHHRPSFFFLIDSFDLKKIYQTAIEVKVSHKMGHQFYFA